MIFYYYLLISQSINEAFCVSLVVILKIVTVYKTSTIVHTLWRSMMPAKQTTDKNSVPPASPQPSLQTTGRDSRSKDHLHHQGSNTNVVTGTTASSAIQKRKKHWRSPSNPIDFNHMSLNLNCSVTPDNSMLKRKVIYFINNNIILISFA